MYRITEVDGRYYAEKNFFGIFWLPLHLQSKDSLEDCVHFIATR